MRPKLPARSVVASIALVPIVLLAARTAPQDGPDPRAVLEVALGEAGIRIDLEHGRCSFPANVLVRDELLEYVLVGPRGSAHESLFVTDVKPSLVNTAILALGIEQGTNATWTRRAEPRGVDEQGAPAPPYSVTRPQGEPVYLYALWKEEGEVHFHRMEDLVRDLSSGRTMRRHAWVFLGSRFAPLREGGEEVFVADHEQNLVNVTFFAAGNTLVTAALDACVDQTIWMANTWLLPERGWPVTVVLSRTALSAPPEELLPGLPTLSGEVPEDVGESR